MSRSTAVIDSKPGIAAQAPPNEVLFRRWQQSGDMRAREQLVERYLPLSRRLARKISGNWDNYEDLAQVASIGLLHAIDRFDPARGIRFESYAVPTIVGELKRHLRDTSWDVHVPRSLQELALKVEQATRQLTVSTGRNPTYQELAQYLEVSVETVLEAAEAAYAHHAASLEAPRRDMFDEQDGQTLGDTISVDDGRFDLVEAAASLGQAACKLTERERVVLARRFVADETQAEIAEAIGVSQMQVSRILRQALSRLEVLMRDTSCGG